MRQYHKFLRSKSTLARARGGIKDPQFTGSMYPFQEAIVRWALRRGTAAIFADCGLGKTLMQLEWARAVVEKTGGKVLILAPLAVSAQTVAEGERFGIDVRYARSQGDIADITVTNYEMIEHFDPRSFAGVVLDESSILKSYTSATRNLIIDSFGSAKYRLACTATPAPNDHMELGNHSEFLGVLTRVEMLSKFFVHDGGSTQNWRLKGHAQDVFWQWVASWAAVVRTPSDLGFSDDGYILPELNIDNIVVDVQADDAPEGHLFQLEASTLIERRAARRSSTEKRARAVADIVNANDGQWIVWCDLNIESEMVTSMIEGAVEVRGSDTRDHKTNSILDFVAGKIRVLVSKPSICGFGMNLQNCHNMVFLGLSDSYEQFYQAVRRCWRFGQRHDVRVHVVTASTEGAVLRNIKRKEMESRKMNDAVVKHSRKEVTGSKRADAAKGYSTETDENSNWAMHLGDCVEVVGEMDSDSIDYTIFSPPFASLYTYSDSDRDMGNCDNQEVFAEHFSYLVGELLRVTAPGRLLSFHCMQLPMSKVRDGHIGLRDFRGDLIRMFVDAGWIYHSEVAIWKDPVTAMQRTKALGLLHKQIRKDSSMCRQGIADYLVTMRKPGENQKRIAHTPEEFPVELWQRYASPIWTDINASRTLQRTSAREEKDERHICPLQLDVIERALDLWTAAGDLVLSPFAGIGSEGYCAVEKGRRFVGVELKRSYYDQACANLREASPDTRRQLQMF